MAQSASASPSTARAGQSRTYEYVRPWLYDLQRAAFFCPERYAISESSTKSGKTVACMVWLAEQAIKGTAGQHFLWLAPIYPQAMIAFERLKRGLPRDIYSARENPPALTLLNGAIIDFKGGDNPDSIFGQDYSAAVVDEASRCREDSWHAVRSTLTATRGPVRIIGNVKGRKNWAYRLARRAEAGEPDMRYSKITAHDAVAAGVLAADEIRDAQATLPEAVFRELYLAEPSDDEGNPFGLDAIRSCIAPLSDDAPVCWGIDLAKSVDFTVAIALDAAGHVCRVARWQASWQDTIARIAGLVRGTRALVDSTGVGDPVLEALQKYSRRFEGYKFTAPSKQQLMEGLAVAIQRRDIRYPAGPITAELEGFEYVYSRTGVHYSAPDGSYDDCVCALALAVEAWGQRRSGTRVLTFDDAAEGPAHPWHHQRLP